MKSFISSIIILFFCIITFAATAHAARLEELSVSQLKFAMSLLYYSGPLGCDAISEDIFLKAKKRIRKEVERRKLDKADREEILVYGQASAAFMLRNTPCASEKGAEYIELAKEVVKVLQVR